MSHEEPLREPMGKEVDMAPDVEGNNEAEETMPAQDPNLVEWDGPNDPENPLNLPSLRRWGITLSLASMTMWITFSSSVFSVATHTTAAEFHASTEVTTLGTSLVVFGFAVGPLFWAPLSELYGRRLPLFLGYGIFSLFQIPVAVAKNLETILVCRFLIGVFGCSPLAVAGGGMADIWDPVDRGVAISFFCSATFLGPILGPIVGGFITQSYLGWRWTAWITLITSGTFGLLAFFIVPETYAPVLLRRKAARLRRQTGNEALRSVFDNKKPSLKEMGTKYFARPFQMLFMEPILICITAYLSLIYGILYLFLEAYPVAFVEVRGWTNEGLAGLPFIGILIGVILGACLIIYNTKTRFARKMAERGSVVPEERLVDMMIAAIVLPVGLFWFGWSTSTHWIAQIIAGVPIGMGILVIFMQGLNYLIDVYMMFANSAIAANTLIRSILGGAFPLFAAAMYHNLGVDWASSLLGFVTAAMIPIPVVFFVYGARIRAMSRYSPKF